MPLALRQQLDQLAQGSFVERGVNVLAFGLPGTGKTHARCAWATAAAIDRVVHHSVILEFDVPSYRTNAAQQRVQAEEVNRQN